MRRHLRCAVILIALLATAIAPAARAAEAVDLLLVLAADVSRSVDSAKFKLQREGYAAAIANGRVIDAIRSGRNQRIAVLFMEWSGNGNQKVVIDWTVLDGPKTAQSFRRSIAGIAARLRRPNLDQRRHRRRHGAIYPRAVYRRTPNHRRVGRRHQQRRARCRAGARRALRLGITINGLVILSETPMPWRLEHTNPPGGLAKYYRDNVTGGPGSFVIEAKDFNSFGEAIIKKMIAEIADATPMSGNRTAIR